MNDATPRAPGTLVLVRHGQSEWNLKNLFTGWTDVDLTDQGVREARAAGRALKEEGISFDIAPYVGVDPRNSYPLADPR